MPEQEPVLFCDLLWNSRQVAGLSQEGLAHAIGRSQLTVHHWETNNYVPVANLDKTLRRISEVLSVSLAALAESVEYSRKPRMRRGNGICIRGHELQPDSTVCLKCRPELNARNYAIRKNAGYHDGVYGRQQKAALERGDLCSLPDCDKPRFSNDMCAAHWGAWSKWGDPLANFEPEPANGYRGVKKQASGSTYLARLKTGGVEHYLGNYATAEEAARAYDAKVIELGLLGRTGKGPKPKLNFPELASIEAGS